MSSAADRVRRNGILDQFCGKKMTYEPVNDSHFDANLFNEQDKLIGFAKIFSQPGNFGNNPIVEISKAALDFLYELGLLMSKKPAAIVKFRNKVSYLRLEHVNYGVGEGRREKVYKIPIGELKLT